MKYVYIAFLAPNNRMGRFIRFLTGNSYSHVALSLDNTICELFSFARRQRSIPLAGGFVTEYPDRYLSGYGDIPLMLVRIALSDEDYLKLIKTLYDFSMRKKDLIYNSIDAVTVSLFRKHVPIKDSYTCLSFCCLLLGLQQFFSISELEKNLDGETVFTGSYSEYVTDSTDHEHDRLFFERVNPVRVVSVTIHHFSRLLLRLILTLYGSFRSREDR